MLAKKQQTWAGAPMQFLLQFAGVREAVNKAAAGSQRLRR